MTAELLERLMANVAHEPMSGCWLWTGPTKGKGYGAFRHQYAHRVAYEMLVGPIPAGLCLDHVVCGVKACVRPDHMEVVTLAENTRRWHLARRGHILADECGTRQRYAKGCRCDRCSAVATGYQSGWLARKRASA